MASKKHYYFIFSNAKDFWMTVEEATIYCRDNGVYPTRNGYELHKGSSKRRIKDGFQSGYNPGLGEYVRGKKHHSEILNRRGLEEAGKEKITQKNTNTTEYFTDEVLTEIANMKGNELSTNELEGLKDE